MAKRTLAACAPRGELGVGIIGTGWGLKVQVPQFRAGGLHVKALYSRDSVRAADLAKEHKIEFSFSDVGLLARCPEVDLVSVVGPAHLRKRQVLEVIAAGKSVIADKPMAITAGEASEMLTAATRLPEGKVALLDFELRCVPAVVRARELMTEGAIGNPLFVTFRCMANMDFLADGAQHSHWNARETGGGVFSAVGTHYVDIVRFLLKDEIGKVSAVEAPLVKTLPPDSTPVTADGYVSANMITARGAVPIHMVISGRTSGGPMENSVKIVGSTGCICIMFATSELQVFKNGSNDPVELLPAAGNAWAEVGTKALAARIKDHFEEGRDISDLATFADGLQVQLVTDAVHHSASNLGEWVNVTQISQS